MRKEDLTLRKAARQGDAQAILRLARRYLEGSRDIPRHVSLGLQYLRPQRASPDAAKLVCECLALDELVAHGQLDILPLAAALSPTARVKLAIWHVLEGRWEEGLESLQACEPEGENLLALWAASSEETRLRILLEHLAGHGVVRASAVAMAAARHACVNGNLEQFTFTLRTAIDLGTPPTISQEWIYKAVVLSEAQNVKLRHLQADAVHDALDEASARGDARAWFILGRALCSFECGPNPATALVRRENVRKGAALLVRAADSGYGQAWLDLYRLHSNARCSVANPEMARFCLEKGASAGDSEAQRRLGALMLREASTVHTMERAVTLLHLAAKQQDSHARHLLESLVLHVDGDDEDAAEALRVVQKADPLLAARLRVSRAFCLTKQEALCLDPVAASRPWGLVTTLNPYLSQSKLAAPRVVPALTTAATEALRASVALFSTAAAEFDGAAPAQGQRRLLADLGVDEELFFAGVSSSERDRVRIGTRWAHHAREQLRAALA